MILNKNHIKNDTSIILNNTMCHTPSTDDVKQNSISKTFIRIALQMTWKMWTLCAKGFHVYKPNWLKTISKKGHEKSYSETTKS